MESINTPAHSAFCRGCGKKIHIEAIQCPQCGAPQSTSRPTSNDAASNYVLPIVSLVFGVLALVGTWSSDTPMSRDELVGALFLVLVATGSGGTSLYLKQPMKAVAIAGLVTAAIALLGCIGSQ